MFLGHLSAPAHLPFLRLHLTCVSRWVPLLLLISCTVAAEYVIPSTWNGTITASSKERQSTIAAAIQEGFANPTSLNDEFFSVLAVYDFYNNTTTYRTQVTAHFANAFFQPNNKVYQDPAMLELATGVWEYGRNYTISPEDVAAGLIATKSFNLTNACYSTTLAGGTFWVPAMNDITLYGVNTGMFLTLSAYLSQATGNATYLSAATESGAFMIDLLYVTSEGNGQPVFSATNGSSACMGLWGPGGDFLIDQAGLFMEGLAVLPGDTTFGLQNLSVNSMRSNIVNVTLATNALCNAPNGIINTGGGNGDSYLVQGLGALYHVMEEPVDLIMYIGSFLSTQYNTLITAATEPGSNIYASSWIGPPEPYNSSSQTMAIFGLVNSAQVINTTSNNGSQNNNGSQSTTGGPSPSGHAQHSTGLVGPIVGGVFGGVIVLAAVGFLINRRRLQRSSTTPPTNLSVDPLVLKVPQPVPPFPPSDPGPLNAEWSLPAIENRVSGYDGSTRYTTDPPSTVAIGNGIARLERHFQMLLSRFQQEGRPEWETEPPAYDASG
ncbi:hypothetical protein BDP27DRAFT_1535447 [Rhodocollybia butyracea]|uniref:Glycoside hydrolase family 76 protein n=1 Tax=Rhodocollybia butyracea TaxID=206335 RepID=A0A9P5PS43_9AGAR|nr:hypothetical protein BDP27DRAFT_1535447 [Rhodocollybia butyracea]